MKKIKGVLVKNGSVQEYELEYNDFKDIYPLLGISCFDVVSRQFGDSILDVYCDDEALLKDELPLMSVLKLDKYGTSESCIYGNVFICNHTKEGEIISLTDKEISDVLQSRIILQNLNTGAMYNAVRSK